MLGVGFNRRPLSLCDNHWLRFRRARDKAQAQGRSLHDAELHVARRILVAIGEWKELD
jgi:hypothetical protein